MPNPDFCGPQFWREFFVLWPQKRNLSVLLTVVKEKGVGLLKFQFRQIPNIEANRTLLLISRLNLYLAMQADYWFLS